MSRTFCDRKAASNRTNFARNNIEPATNTQEIIPDLVADSDSDYESDFEMDSDFNISMMANSPCRNL